jgi:hypothetical protein
MLEKTLLSLPKQQAVGFSAIILSLSAMHNNFICTFSCHAIAIEGRKSACPSIRKRL